MPQTNLRVLFVEASEDDLLPVLAKLTSHGFCVEYLQVADADSMTNALNNQTWDVVLCSYNPPAFGGLEALTLMQSINPDTPFLFISHNLREENIIQAIQAGAGDYIYKGSLNRLIPAIEHYLSEARIRQEHRQMLHDLKENQTRLQALISNFPGMVYQLLQNNEQNISIPYVSDGSLDLLGVHAKELLDNPNAFINLLHPDDIKSYQKAMQKSATSMNLMYWEGRIKSRPDDAIKWVNLRCSPRKMPQGIQWECVMFNITERKLAEIEILRSREQLRELSAHIQDVREQERLSLAREVHDDMGSMLTAIKLDLSWLGNRLNIQDSQIEEKIHDIEDLVGKCAVAASNIARNLRPSALDSFGIVAAMEIEVTEFTQRTGIRCKLEKVDDEISVNPNIAITLFRILQEALNNIVKHAQASKVTVIIHNLKNIVSLTVSDNGRGLQDQDKQKPRSFGLRGIQERVARFGGEVIIKSSPGEGTTISVKIPQAEMESEFEQMHQQTLF